MKKEKKLLGQLFTSFLKIGAFTFGGGLAMIPLIQKEAVENRGWVTDGDLLEIVSIAESTPGPIAVNAATFVGYRAAGFWGAFCATFGVILPSFVTIILISFLLRRFQSLQAVQYAFWGVRTAVVALLLKSVWSMYRQCPKGRIAYVCMGAAFVLTAFTKVHVLAVIAGCALFGWVSAAVVRRRAEQ